MSWIDRLNNERDREIEEANARRADSEQSSQDLETQQEAEDKELIEELRGNLDFLSPEELLEDINQAYWSGKGLIVEVGEVIRSSYQSHGSLDNTISLGMPTEMDEVAYGGYSLVKLYRGVEDISEIDTETDAQEHSREFEVTFYDRISIGYTSENEYYVSSGSKIDYHPEYGVFGGPGEQKFNFDDENEVLEEVQRELVNAAEELEEEE